MTTIYLVDDHELFLSGVRAELSERFEVAGWSTDVDAAVDGIRRTRPDVVLVDVHMPGGGGLSVVGNIQETNPDVRFLALSVSDAPEDVIAKGPLKPGEMIAVDTKTSKLLMSEDIDHQLQNRHPYETWMRERLIRLSADRSHARVFFSLIGDAERVRQADDGEIEKPYPMIVTRSDAAVELDDWVLVKTGPEFGYRFDDDGKPVFLVRKHYDQEGEPRWAAIVAAPLTLTFGGLPAVEQTEALRLSAIKLVPRPRAEHAAAAFPVTSSGREPDAPGRSRS